MNEFHLEFAEKLTEAADFIAQDLEEIDSKRTTLYLSLVACEISLKFVLENAGFTIKEIKKFNHDISKILNEITVSVEIFRLVQGVGEKWTPASTILGKLIMYGEAESTVGEILTSKNDEVSTYPNQIRYGEYIRHFPPEVILETAKLVHDWAKEYSGKFRIKNSPTK